jgi:hypothetical protein
MSRSRKPLSPEIAPMQRTRLTFAGIVGTHPVSTMVTGVATVWRIIQPLVHIEFPAARMAGNFVKQPSQQACSATPAGVAPPTCIDTGIVAAMQSGTWTRTASLHTASIGGQQTEHKR